MEMSLKKSEKHLFAKFVHHAFELIDVFKISVDTGKPHVSDFVEFSELAHDELSKALRAQLSDSKAQEFFFNALNGRVHLLGAHRAFAQGQVHGRAQFGAFKFNSATVFFDNRGKAHVGSLIGSTERLPSLPGWTGAERLSAIARGPPVVPSAVLVPPTGVTPLIPLVPLDAQQMALDDDDDDDDGVVAAIAAVALEAAVAVVPDIID